MTENKYLLFATEKGFIKKTTLEEYDNIRQSGLIAINLDKDDQLLAVQPTTGQDQILLVSSNGKSIRFHEKDVRPTGRATRGVRGIHMQSSARLVGMSVIYSSTPNSNDSEVLIISEHGYGKTSKLAEYKVQGRGGQGIFTARVSEKTGQIVAMRLIPPNQNEDPDVAAIDQSADLLVISQKGQTIRLPLDSIPCLGRQTQGVRVLKLNSGDKATALAVL